MTTTSDRTQKYATEMNRSEFESWATGFILFGVGEGTPLKTIVAQVCSQAAGNKLWGGGKPVEKEYDLSFLTGMSPRHAVLHFLWVNRKISSTVPVDDIVHFVFDHVKTEAKDKNKSIRNAILSLKIQEMVSLGKGCASLTKKGAALVSGLRGE